MWCLCVTDCAWFVRDCGCFVLIVLLVLLVGLFSDGLLGLTFSGGFVVWVSIVGYFGCGGYVCSWLALWLCSWNGRFLVVYVLLMYFVWFGAWWFAAEVLSCGFWLVVCVWWFVTVGLDCWVGWFADLGLVLLVYIFRWGCSCGWLVCCLDFLFGLFRVFGVLCLFAACCICLL